MISTLHKENILSYSIDRLRCYFELLKPRLSFLVAFSSVFGFVLGSSAGINWPALIMLGLGGFLVSGASVTINQILEKDLDGLMQRTQHRPLPSMRIRTSEAVLVAVIAGLLGISILLKFTNPLTVMLSIAPRLRTARRLSY